MPSDSRFNFTGRNTDGGFISGCFTVPADVADFRPFLLTAWRGESDLCPADPEEHLFRTNDPLSPVSFSLLQALAHNSTFIGLAVSRLGKAVISQFIEAGHKFSQHLDLDTAQQSLNWPTEVLWTTSLFSQFQDNPASEETVQAVFQGKFDEQHYFHAISGQPRWDLKVGRAQGLGLYHEIVFQYPYCSESIACATERHEFSNLWDEHEEESTSEFQRRAKIELEALRKRKFEAAYELARALTNREFT